MRSPLFAFPALFAFPETLYSSTGLVWRTIDPRGAHTETDYDSAGRPEKVWQPDPDTGLVSASTSPMTETIYDDAGNVYQQINPRGKTWTYGHDARNRKVNETAPSFLDKDGISRTPVSSFGYDGVGNVIQTVDPRGLVTTTKYDHANRPFLTTTSSVPVYDADTGTVSSVALETETEYDENGNPTLVTDASGSSTANFYDALNRLTDTATNPQTGNPSITPGAPATGDIIVSYLYDDAGNRILVEDGEGALTAFRYDGLGRNTQTIWDIGSNLPRTKTLFYDEVVMTSRTDEKGQVTNYSYDDLHRLEDVSNVSRSVDDRHYDYDANGNILAISYPSDPGTPRAVTNVYDYLNRLASETSAGVVHGYEYDKAGNTELVTYGLTNRQIVSTYDDLNRLKTMTEGSRVTTYFYDSAGSITRKDLGNGVSVESTYDLLGRKKTSTKTASGAPDPFASYTYAHDGVGNLGRIQEAYPGGQLTYREVRNAYDHTYRLDTETILSGGVTTITDYDYDDANNRIRKGLTVGSDPEEVTIYEYGDGSAASGGNSNQLVLTTLPDTSEVTYTYDANGNRASRTEDGQTDVYGYDYENRLLSLNYQTGDSDTGTYEYEYDHRTRRVVRDESNITGRDLHLVSFSHGLSVQEHTTSISATPDVEYIRGSDYGGGIGGLLYSFRSGTPSFKHYNSRGDVVAATDASGSLTYQAAYEAFGKHGDTPTSEEWGNNPDPQQANTKEEDPTGLLNEGFRYRDLETGTFITRDPLGFVDGPNVYTYVVQNPWTYFDPHGLEVKWYESMIGWSEQESDIRGFRVNEGVPEIKTSRFEQNGITGAVRNSSGQQWREAEGLNRSTFFEKNPDSGEWSVANRSDFKERSNLAVAGEVGSYSEVVDKTAQVSLALTAAGGSAGLAAKGVAQGASLLNRGINTMLSWGGVSPVTGGSTLLTGGGSTATFEGATTALGISARTGFIQASTQVQNLAVTAMGVAANYGTRIAVGESLLTFGQGISGDAPNPIKPSIRDALPDNPLADFTKAAGYGINRVANYVDELISDQDKEE